jgi:hypothetical protein
MKVLLKRTGDGNFLKDSDRWTGIPAKHWTSEQRRQQWTMKSESVENIVLGEVHGRTCAGMAEGSCGELRQEVAGGG